MLVEAILLGVALGLSISLPCLGIYKLYRNKKNREEEEARKEVLRRENTRKFEAERIERIRIDGLAKRESTLLWLNITCDCAISSFEKIPDFLFGAQKHLTQAKTDFSERAFSPFWDSIEKSLEMIGGYGECIQNISKHMSSYKKYALRYDGTPPSFPLTDESIESVKSTTTVVDQFHAIVRLAQRDFQFASIYEQRKTNRILVSGFNTIAEAIHGIGDDITRTVRDFSTQTSALLGNIQNSIDTAHLQAQQSRSELIDIAERESHNQQLRHNQVLQRLNTIQFRTII